MPRFYPSSSPRMAADGIRVASRRGAIGQSWWSRRFLEVLAYMTISSRLERGKSYARTGQVLALTIETGMVRAQVQGSRRKPYNVTIEWRPLDEDDWECVESELAREAQYAARLLNGELPPEVEEVMAAHDLSLFPVASFDWETHCSCPDYANPCKHLAAVFYVLAERFDENPWDLVLWRGRDRETFLAGLQRELAEPDTRADNPLADFWRMGPMGGLGEVQAVPAGILHRLGRSGIRVSGQDLADWLLSVYREASEAAEGH